MSDNAYLHGVHSEEQERLAELNRLTNAPFISFLNLPQIGRVLEVGSGLGLLASEVARTSPDLVVTGLERSEEQIACARNVPGNLTLLQGDAHHLPFEDNHFDIVYCRYVLEHLTDPMVALREMYRVLMPGGQVAVQENDMSKADFDPACPAATHWIAKMIETQAAVGGDALVGRKLFGLLKRAGFEGIELSLQPELHWYGSPGYERWLTNAVSIIRGASMMMFDLGKINSAEADAAIEELHALSTNDFGSALFHWNRAEAIKPLIGRVN